MMTILSVGILTCTFLLTGYAYVGYPLILRFIAGSRREGSGFPAEWPLVSITVPAYNEERQIGGAIESLLDLDYPADRRQIIVVSDCSTDRTEEIVRAFADRGVQLVRTAERAGKTSAENTAAALLRGELVLNTDASVRIHRDALKNLVAAFQDASVGVASARDVSVGGTDGHANAGEGGYVGYEMWVRDLETRCGSIVGASGCCYLIRSVLHRLPIPDSLSRDFSAALKAREHGLRAVSVSDAVCFVPRTSSLRDEYRRKVRTITRGVETLVFKKHLLNPFRFGRFSWMLWSHKVCRWIIPWFAVPALLALGILSGEHPAAAVLLLGAVILLVTGVVGWWLEGLPRVARLLRAPAFLVVGNLAVLHACARALHGDRNPVWEPTRRGEIQFNRKNIPA